MNSSPIYHLYVTYLSFICHLFIIYMSFIPHCDVPCHDTFTTSNMMKAVAISVWSIRVDFSDTAVVDAEGK